MKTLTFSHNSNIDTAKWDSCIQNAPNSRIYGFSWYLDIIFPEWYGLIYGDFEYVMPVFISKKWGLKYILQPPYAQQTGVFPNPEQEIMLKFTRRLSQEARYIQTNLNNNNHIPKNWEIISKENLLLNLNDTYQNIRSGFNKHTKRYTNKAQKNVNINEHITIKQYIDLKKAASGKFINDEILNKLRLILLKSQERNMLELLAAYDQQNELCAAAAFIHDPRRITYINGVSSDLGKTHRAMYAIFNHFLHKNTENPKVLDFEGSSIPGVARFFRGFGAQPEQYYLIKQNRLPFLIKGLIK
ncbi:hypothetical protein [Salinivirga cyanobacteriivorans]